MHLHGGFRGGGKFVFWFSKVQENAFLDVFLRFTMVYRELIASGTKLQRRKLSHSFKSRKPFFAKKFISSTEKWGGHAPDPPVAWALAEGN